MRTTAGTMRRSLIAALLAGSLGVAPAAPPAAIAQTPTTVTLSQSAAPPDADVTVPVYFAPADGVRVGRLELTVRYPESDLVFVRAELSGLSEGVGVTLQATPEAGPQSGTQQMTLVLTAAATGSSREPLPDGPLVHLTFHVAATAKPGATIALAPRAMASSQDDPPRPVEPLIVPEGEIVVQQPGITSCFFYMH